MWLCIPSISISNCSSSCAPSSMLSFYFFLSRFHLLLKQMVKRLLKITLTVAVVIFSCRGGKCNGSHHRDSGGSNHNTDRIEICPRIEATNSGSGTGGAKIVPRVNVAKATKAAATTIVTTGAMAATTPPLSLPPIVQSHTPVVTLAPLTPLLSTDFIHIRGCVGNSKMFNQRRCKTGLVGQSVRLFVPRSPIRFRQKLQKSITQIYIWVHRASSKATRLFLTKW